MTRESNSFDFLRLVAATFVLVSHGAGFWDGRNDWFADHTGLTTLGTVGVAMFFSISGYWVTASWSNAASPRTFMANRALRIFPGLAACVLVTAFVLGPLVTTLDARGYFTSPLTWAYLKNAVLDLQWPLPGVFEANAMPKAVNGSLWTLPVEVFAYFTLGVLALVKGLDRRVAPILALAFFVLYVVSSQGLVPWLPGRILTSVLPVADTAKLLMAFYIGATLRLDSGRWGRPWITLALAIAAIATSRTAWAPAFTIAAVAHGVILLGRHAWPVVHHAGRFGDFSYGLYLYAYPLQQALAGPWRPDVGVVTYQLISFAMVLAVAIVSWFVVEKPALRLKRRTLLPGGRVPTRDILQHSAQSVSR
ncbi:hypothetical protein BWI17_13575 [Betaproteobacteria bacterium GR16-43]|nr:hypothetical protein BWI17_13575 [Betaproteobacteria bacterium GR16-43]